MNIRVRGCSVRQKGSSRAVRGAVSPLLLLSALPAIALLQPRNQQAPLSRSSVALSRTHCRPRAAERDGAGPGGRGGGGASPDAGSAGERDQRCDEFLYQMRHTHQPVLVITNGPVPRRSRASERFRRQKESGEAAGTIVGRGWSCCGEGDARFSTVLCAVRRGSAPEHTPIRACRGQLRRKRSALERHAAARWGRPGLDCTTAPHSGGVSVRGSRSGHMTARADAETARGGPSPSLLPLALPVWSRGASRARPRRCRKRAVGHMSASGACLRGRVAAAGSSDVSTVGTACVEPVTRTRRRASRRSGRWIGGVTHPRGPQAQHIRDWQRDPWLRYLKGLGDRNRLLHHFRPFLSGGAESSSKLTKQNNQSAA